MPCRICALAVCLGLFACAAVAQETMAPLQGYVLAEGKPLEGATVVLVDESREKTRATTELPTDPLAIASDVTDANGSFFFFDVPRRKLSLEVSEPGFVPFDRGVEFSGSPLTVRISLTRGTVAFKEAVPVVGEEETIFYATDRKPSGSIEPTTFFTNERSLDGMHYGTATVSVPSTGNFNGMSSAEIFGLQSDRVLNVVLVTVQSEPKAAFFSELTRVDRGGDALVFIHGYANSFEYAARRLGALKHDLNFSGPAILYSWASRDSYLDYSDDEATVDWSSAHFQQFLRDLARAGIGRVHLVAHSMGSRILLRGLEGCSVQHVGQVVFAAPDVDADTFREALPVIDRLADRLTEYANDRDKALLLSATKHGLSRAGQLQAAIRDADEDVIDATRVDTSLLHHSYFVDSPQVVSDIALVIAAKRPPRPRLVQIRQGQIKYWQLQR